ncbi:hypothetical protein [Litchfieldia salsa]|uniref:Uncharacterized protein n=1 Tax=Litchfieldia salsa TaxID=930152 RepID=A0A1H0TYZ4_9BACI|nr:hypothetical protein [Litchfieldia salsa]SDP58995.1 hypothetical protein SAMN05216565_10426 [Litchfieldia salsa]
MYDYISIHSDKLESFIETEVIENFLEFNLMCTKLGTLEFIKDIGEYSIYIRGINANSQGNYAYNSSEKFKEINLIEIDIPNKSNDAVEAEILKIAQKISNEYLWEIDLRE